MPFFINAVFLGICRPTMIFMPVCFHGIASCLKLAVLSLNQSRQSLYINPVWALRRDAYHTRPIRQEQENNRKYYTICDCVVTVQTPLTPFAPCWINEGLYINLWFSGRISNFLGSVFNLISISLNKFGSLCKFIKSVPGTISTFKNRMSFLEMYWARNFALYITIVFQHYRFYIMCHWLRHGVNGALYMTLYELYKLYFLIVDGRSGMMLCQCAIANSAFNALVLP